MKILFVNKFLYPKAGAEVYMFGLAEQLRRAGHETVFFGMEDKKNTVNIHRGDINVKNKDFHNSALLERLGYPLSIIYSPDARRKMRKVLSEEKPDIIHLNNINYQITPSVIYEMEDFGIPVVMTLHDANIICPNHSLYNYAKNEICTLCRHGRFANCVRTRCIHNSAARSVIGCIESSLYRYLGTYSKINTLISPSKFLADTVRDFGLDHPGMRILRNFSPPVAVRREKDAGYVLYCGRLCISKGLDVLAEAARRLPDIDFVVAGEGDYAPRLEGYENIKLKGFLSGNELRECMQKARITVVPSSWQENCSMTILESKSYGVPVIASDTGGNPEIVRDGIDGLLFKRGNFMQLADMIGKLYNDADTCRRFSHNSLEFAKANSPDIYANRMVDIYGELLQTQKRRVVCDAGKGVI